MRYISKDEILTISDESFKKYGRVLNDDFSDIIDYLNSNTSIPKSGNLYVPSDNKFENIASYNEVVKKYYGCQDIQFGYCNGHNERLNALEYHSSNEINIAATDFILLLGDVRGIKNGEYRTDRVEAFYIYKGQGIEIFSTTLHFSPIRINNEGFRCAVLLPRHTNEPISVKEKGLLYKNNKWILTHPDNERLIDDGVNGRLIGENIEYKI